MGWYLYLLAALLLAVAFQLRRAGGKNSIRGRDLSGNVVVGDVSGTVTQTSSRPRAADQKPDRIAWAIAILGVLIAAAQLGYSIVHDVLVK